LKDIRHFAGCCYIERHIAECFSAKCCFIERHIAECHSAECCYIERHIVECHSAVLILKDIFAECHSAGCCYIERHIAVMLRVVILGVIVLSVAMLLNSSTYLGE
jgi:hypothetical protein